MHLSPLYRLSLHQLGLTVRVVEVLTARTFHNVPDPIRALFLQLDDRSSIKHRATPLLGHNINTTEGAST